MGLKENGNMALDNVALSAGCSGKGMEKIVRYLIILIIRFFFLVLVNDSIFGTKS